MALDTVHAKNIAGSKAMAETDQAEGLRTISRALDSLRGSPLKGNGEPEFRKIDRRSTGEQNGTWNTSRPRQAVLEHG